MLIYFHKRFVLEGETTIKQRKHFWNRKVDTRQKIYHYASIDGICDEKDLDKEIERLTSLKLKSSGYGKNFSGWQRVVPEIELFEIARDLGWDMDTLPTGNISIEYVNQWTMDKIIKHLTGEQFIQFCKENDINLNGLKGSF